MAGMDTVSDDIRERVRFAVATLVRRKKRISVNSVSTISGGNRNKVAHVVRAYKAGQLPDPGTTSGGKGNWSTARTRPRPANAPAPAPATAPATSSQPSAPAPIDTVDLAQLLERAREEEELDLAASKVAAAVASGELEAQRGNVIKHLISERRQLLKQQRNAPKEDPEEILLASKDGALVLAAYERICGMDRRAQVLDFVRDKLAEDVRELPAVDPLGAL